MSQPMPPAAPSLELSYAPPARSKARPAVVILCGLITTAISLLVVWWINEHSQTNVMGFYADYVFPVGALLVGLVAGSGYGIASFVTGVKIRRGLLAMILALQALAYGGAQYVEYLVHDPWKLVDTGGTTVVVNGKTLHLARVGFFEYFHRNATGFAWKDEKTDKPGEPLGMWGYAFRGLEVAGFLFGGIIVPLVLMAAAYCELCQMYMKTRPVTLIPASTAARKVSKKDAQAMAQYQLEMQSASDAGAARLEQLLTAATTGDLATFNQIVAEHTPLRKRIAKLPRRIEVKLVRCKNCSAGYLKVAALQGQGKQQSRKELGKTEIHPEFVRALA